MFGRVKNLYLLFTIFLMASCASTGNHYLPIENDLEEWIDEELVPQVSDALSSHPRLQHQPFVIVGMHNDDTLAEIDALSSHIRQRLQHGLRRAPGAVLMWQPGRIRGQHHRSLDQVECTGTLQQPALQVGIDSQISPLTGKLNIAVKAVDLREGQWITGFGQHWEGEATYTQRDALRKKGTDEYLRGLRELPFLGGDADLLASYLAHNLSCILREVRDGKISIYSPKLESNPPFFKTAINLLDNYLGRFNEVRIVESEEKAVYVLNAEAHDLNNGLYQVWARVIRKKDQSNIGGANTQTYVRFKDQSNQSMEKKLAVNNHNDFLRRDNRNLSQTSDLDLRLITPSLESLCTENNPWARGSQVLTAQDRISNDSCFAIEINTVAPENLLVLIHGSNGQLQKLLPNECGIKGLTKRNGSNDLVTYMPILNGKAVVFDFERGEGNEWVYALTSNDSVNTDVLDSFIDLVPDICDANGQYFTDIHTFRQQLEKLSEHNNVNLSAAVVKHL